MAIRQIKASGNWSNSAIWEGGIYPLSADDVIANSPNSTYVIALNTHVSVNSISNYDTFQWNNTAITVTNKFNNNGILDIGYGTKYLSGILNNFGIINQVDSYNYYSSIYYGDIYLNNASQIINKSDATYNLTSGRIQRNVPSDYQGVEAKFVNQGALNKINTSYSASIYVNMENTGLINIAGGTLYLYDELINNGTVNINAGGIYNSGQITNNNVINLNAGTASFVGGGINKGKMYVDIDAALTLGGTFNFATGSQITGRGSVTLNAGQYNLNVSQTTLSNDLTFGHLEKSK